MQYSKAKFNEEELEEIREECANEFRELLMHIENPVFCILQGHMYIEIMMDRYFVSELPNGDLLTKEGNLSFKQKIALMQSIGPIDSATIKAIKALNTLRNKLVHRLHHQITAQQIDSLGSHFPEIYAEIVKIHKDCLADKIKSLMSFLVGCIASRAHFSEAITKKNNEKIC